MSGHALTPIIAMQQQAEMMRKLEEQLRQMDALMTKHGWHTGFRRRADVMMRVHVPVEGAFLHHACQCGQPTPDGYVQHVVDKLWA